MSDNDKPFYLPFLKKEKLNKYTYTFYFARTKEARPFVAGQYYEIKLPHKNMDERGDSRVFTISSSPTNKEYVTITTRIIESTFKLSLANLIKGEMVHFDGPWDDLNFDESEKMPHVFLAGGIGITPYHSIVKYSIDKKLNHKMFLFVSWKKREDMVFHEFFIDAQKNLPNFKYIPTLTEEKSLPKKEWKWDLGRIDEKMIRRHMSGIPDSKYYISGPQIMVNTLKKLVVEMGVLKDNIIAEEFEGY